MRGKTSLVVGAVAALALTLTGCGGEEDGKNPAAADKPKQKSSASPHKDSASPSAKPSAGKSASPSAKPSAKPKPTAAKPTSKAPAPRPSNGSGSTGGSSGGGAAAPASVQGSWYYPFLIRGKAITMTVNGTSFTVTAAASGGKSCSGTINSSMQISSSCGGKPENGRAVLGEGGQKLTLQWNSGQPDRFVRTRPQ
ncbi:hypothetical protein ACQEU8_31345 [Streptomyces sp. CA-250714]|uniref:hypothetical protein n=1 Tax=Streptomyces sp. CA-250714 TaxID=3240060 RepID=UPI003D8FD100